MALLNDPDQLSQGTPTTSLTITFGTPSGSAVQITGTGFPAVDTNDYIAIRGAANTNNNGLYRVGATHNSTTMDLTKISGSNPVAAGSAAGHTILGKNTLSTDKLNVFYDTAARFIYLLEQNGLGADGVTFNAWYSFTKEEWKSDNFLRKFPLPVFAVDLDAGKYIVGTDGAKYNGWRFKDVTSPLIRTRKLFRGAGWSEFSSAGVLLAQYAGIQTLGTFEDPVNDNAYYQFGTDTTVNDTVNFTFNGPVDEAILCYEEQALISNLAITTNNTITRGSGSFITEGYKVGGAVTIRAAEDSGNNGTFTLTGVTALALTVSGTPLTNNADDDTAVLSVDNRSALTLKLRVRDGDTYGKTYSSADLTSAGETTLGNRLFKFPLSNATDLNIGVTDVGIDANSDGTADVAPYSGMSITYHPTPQSQTGLVGGSFNFGVTIDANNATTKQVYEFVQWSLRRTTDIDNDGSTAIGRTMGDLLVFEGSTLIAGKAGSVNPSGGGTGVRITNINSAYQNDLRMYDNTGTERRFPETIAVTLDFNDAITNDAASEYVLYYDRTIRTTVSDLVITAVSGATGTFTSAGSNLPTNAEVSVGDYVRIEGLVGANEAMNGIYQITALTTPNANWSVVRYDGQTVVTTTSASASLDQNPIDSPDAIIVKNSSNADVTGAASSDYTFSYDYDGNVQGGRVVSTPTYVVARAIGLSNAQYVQSSVQTITSGTPLTIVLTASNELNYRNA